MDNSAIVREIAEYGGVEAYLKAQSNKGMLRFLTCGSVDDGKSTLIGRLLHDTRQIYEDQLSSLHQTSKRHGTQGENLDLALLVAGLQAEREQGITIDVAYRYFSTQKRKFIIADTPGHEQYTRNMATGASTCELAVVLIDARKGVLDQTRRHSFIVSLLGIRHLVVAVNKMDLVDNDQDVFEKIRSDYLDLAEQLPGKLDIRFVPLSALTGDNIVERTGDTPWYTGPSLLELLETIQVTPAAIDMPLRFPVQYVNRPDLDFRGYAGTVAGGTLTAGQAIKALPSGRTSHIDRIVTFDGDLNEAQVGQAVTVTLKDELDISRGDLIVAADDTLKAASGASVDVVWMTEAPLEIGKRYLLKVAGESCQAQVTGIDYQVEINTLAQVDADALPLNGIGRVRLAFDKPLLIDPYTTNSVTGGAILIDRISNVTVGAAMVHDTLTDASQGTPSQYSAFELELNALVRRHFPHWNVRDLLNEGK
ncbi:sulfate adenylyltransferase subunit CysN [Zymobacter palmae]|nr:sulfate adenylyltransferase subunit CysN [Zymobacter palmae]